MCIHSHVQIYMLYDMHVELFGNQFWCCKLGQKPTIGKIINPREVFYWRVMLSNYPPIIYVYTYRFVLFLKDEKQKLFFWMSLPTTMVILTKRCCSIFETQKCKKSMFLKLSGPADVEVETVMTRDAAGVRISPGEYLRSEWRHVQALSHESFLWERRELSGATWAEETVCD